MLALDNWLLGLVFFGFEAQRFLAGTAADNLVQAYESAAADEEDVGCIHRGEFLVGMFAAPLRRDVGVGAFEDLEQRLLHALAGNVAGDGRVFVFASDLVYFVNVDDSGLSAAYVAIGCLQQFEDDVLDVFADVAGLGQCGGVNDGERNVQHAGQGLRHQRLAGAGGADEHDVGLRQFNAIVGLLAIHVDALVVVVNRYCQLLLGLLLADHVLVEESLDFSRLGKLVGSGRGRGGGAIVFENRVADGHALVADVRPGIVTRGRDQLGYGVLRLVAERAAQNFFSSGPVFHSALLLYSSPFCFLPPPAGRNRAPRPRK